MVDSELYENVTRKLYVFIVVVMVVTEANKEEYVSLTHRSAPDRRVYCGAVPCGRGRPRGVGNVLPLGLLRVSHEHEHEYEQLIGGIPEIGTRFTDFRWYEKTVRVVLGVFLHVTCGPRVPVPIRDGTTGTSRVPVNGFKNLKGGDGPRCFAIEKSKDPSGLPRSHPCSNRLDLSSLYDYESLQRKLCFVIECTFPLDFFL